MQNVMACCKPVVAACPTGKIQISSVGCCCRIADSSTPQFPALNVADLGLQSFKKVKHVSLGDAPSSLNPHEPRENPSKFELFYHPKRSSESKIYVLVSSYLI
jgi:hypothetical protein